MGSVSRLGHVAIRVEDVDRAVVFYTGLGMRLVWKADDWCYLEAGEGRDGLALLGPGYKTAGPHFAFHFKNREDVDLPTESMLGLSMTIVMAPPPFI